MRDRQINLVELARFAVIDHIVTDLGIEGIEIGRLVDRIGRLAWRIGNVDDADGGTGVLVQFIMCIGQYRAGVGCEIPAQGTLDGPVVLAAKILAGGGVGVDAVTLVHDAIQTDGDLVVDGQVQQAFDALLVIFADADTDFGFELVAGLAGGD